MSYTSIGLVFDIIGVALIGWQIAFARDEDLKSSRTAHYGRPKEVPKDLNTERLLMRIGLVFLIIGFSLQLIGSL